MIRQRAPDGIGVHRRAEGGSGVEALLAHHLLGVHAPALDELGGVGEHPGQARVLRRDGELEVVARVCLVDARVRDRGVVVLQHRVGVVVHGRRHDVDAALVGVEAGGREVGRERHHAAQVLRRGDDLDDLVVRDGDDVVLDEVGARAAHRVLVALERVLEGGRVVRLEALDDGRQVRVGVQLAGGGPARLGVRAQLLPADLQDRVRVQVAEGPQADQLVVALAAQRPVVGGAGQRPVQPGGVGVEGRAGAVDRAVQAGELSLVHHLLGGLPDLGEEAGRSFA